MKRHRLHIACVFGTRPEAIKMAPVVRAISRRRGMRASVWLTDQHADMLAQVLDVFRLEVHHRLGGTREGQSPVEVTCRVLAGLERLLAAERPDAVLVQGDTTSAMAGALAAFHARVPVGHVEAGLRTYDLAAPFPEEANRRLITVLARWHFAPTNWARDNLLREGAAAERVFVTGNTVIDALRWIARSEALADGDGGLQLPGADGRHAAGRHLVLVTAHRRESFGEPMRELCGALRLLVERNDDVELVFPVHPNPNVRAPVGATLAGHPRIHLLAPLDHWSFLAVLRRCHFVITDSGGVQEEAPAFGKPVLVLRDTTERPEGVAAGTARLVGTDRARIVAEAERLLREPGRYEAMARAHSPYGDGHAARRIAALLATSLRAQPASARVAEDWNRPPVDSQLPQNGGAAEGSIELVEENLQRDLAATIRG